MRGENGDVDVFGDANVLASVPDADLEGVWRILTERLLRVPAYEALFASAFPHFSSEDLHFRHAGEALAHFVAVEFAMPGSPWDRFLSGEDFALSDVGARGAVLFYTDAGCHGCHGGDRLTRDLLHNMGVRPITRGPSETQFVDLGAAHRSHAGGEGRFAFRTPSLHNVAETGPWMHNGAYTTLEAVVRHHLDREAGLREYDRSQLQPEFQNQVHRSDEVIEDVLATLSDDHLPARAIDDDEVGDLVAFLESLTSPAVGALGASVPDEVPSGLPMDVDRGQ
jgi:cytochrome c peroxidase